MCSAYEVQHLLAGDFLYLSFIVLGTPWVKIRLYCYNSCRYFYILIKTEQFCKMFRNLVFLS